MDVFSSLFLLTIVCLHYRVWMRQQPPHQLPLQPGHHHHPQPHLQTSHLPSLHPVVAAPQVLSSVRSTRKETTLQEVNQLLDLQNNFCINLCSCSHKGKILKFLEKSMGYGAYNIVNAYQSSHINTSVVGNEELIIITQRALIMISFWNKILCKISQYKTTHFYG